MAIGVKVKRNPGSGWRGWPNEKKLLTKFCAENGYELVESEAAYITAKLKTENVCIVIYPHQTKSTGNRHLRVRSEHSKDEQKAYDIMCELDQLAGSNCTFSLKGN
jgi:hypothetical protein